jgi:NADPH:quinone reductase-like Zn-dependent oxidoreductase
VLKPKIRIMGCDVAGRIEAVGARVEHFKVGDDVYGDLSEGGFGAFAEYVAAPAHSLALKPRNLTYEQAAAIPHAGMLAQQALTEIGHVDQVDTLLVNGAGGGVGPIGIQLAKLHGVEVTGVDSVVKQGYLRSLGCDHVVDYEQEDFTKMSRCYDLILDVKTNRSPFAYARVLTPGGTYVTVGGSTPRLLECLALGRWIARRQNRNIRILGLKPTKGLAAMTTLAEAGKIVPSIDAVYPLSEVPEALLRFGAATHTGKIIIRMS